LLNQLAGRFKSIKILDTEGVRAMKELANTFAQLAAIIMILVTLAVSTAAISQWAGVDGPTSAAQGLQLSYGNR
jgi:hypothetical protein